MEIQHKVREDHLQKGRGLFTGSSFLTDEKGAVWWHDSVIILF